MLHNIIQIAKKELSGSFSSLTAFIFFGVFLAAVLFKFFWLDTFFVRNIADVRPIFEAMPLLLIFLVSAMTMKMWSEERRSGTLELLLTTPRSNAELVFGKFLSCLALVGIALALTLPLPFMVALFGNNLDWGPVIGGYLASMFLASAYIAIGLLVSTRTENQIVSLLLSILICGAFLIVGTDSITALFGTGTGEILKLIGCGSRFQSITRGVVDFRDLYYYLSIAGVFLSLNILNLEQLRWAGNLANARHRSWSLVTALLVANFVVGNFWLQQVTWARIDMTAGQMYTLSPATKKYLDQLQEPLLIRGFFSKKTHALLAPLVPELRDLLKEYALAGKGKVRVEFLDPLENPELEKEANQKYGIKPVALQSSNRYQAAVTNSYFDLLIKYGDQFEHLSFKDLIELKGNGQRDFRVELRNPEYDITNAIRKLTGSFQGSNNLFGVINKPIKFTGYLSPDGKLPGPLIALKLQLRILLEQYKKESNGKFSFEIIDPDADGGKTARRLESDYGYRPMAVGLMSSQHFWFYMNVSSADKNVEVPLPDGISKDALDRSVRSALKHFNTGFLKIIGIVPPTKSSQSGSPNQPDMDRDVTLLKDKLEESYTLKDQALSFGRIDNDVDLLIVISPADLDQTQLFAIDQFLMKGGTVILATSSFAPRYGHGLHVKQIHSGLTEWLSNNGLKFEDSVVMDKQDFPLPVPIKRNVNGFEIEETRLVHFPYFVDVRSDGMVENNALTAGIDNVILQWPSPVVVDRDKNSHRNVIRLLRSSPESWTTDMPSSTPNFSPEQPLGFPIGKDLGRKLLAVVVEGSFDSYFKDKKSPLKDSTAVNLLEKSPPSSRIVLIGSSCFLTDRLLYVASQVLGSSYTKSVDLVENTIDWSLQDRDLLSIRGRGHFARTLRPLHQSTQVFFEYLNYGFAAISLLLVWLIRNRLRSISLRKYDSLALPPEENSAEPENSPSAPQSGNVPFVGKFNEDSDQAKPSEEEATAP